MQLCEETCELALAPHEWRVEPAREAGCRPHVVDPPRRDRRRAALQCQLALRLGETGVADEPERRVAGEDPVRPGLLLETLGGDDRRPGRERMPARGIAGDHLSRLDSDPRHEPEVGDRTADLDGRPHGAEGVVLVGDGNAEDGHHRIADVLLDGSAVTLDGAARGRVVALLDGPQRLRVEAVEELARFNNRRREPSPSSA